MIKPLSWYRLAHWLHLRRIPLLPKLIDFWVRLVFACWVPHSATIGSGTVLGYCGLSIVIHGRAAIGCRVHIDQGVTIGGNAREEGVPTIEDDVYIGAGAKILGPIVIGRGAVIGANAVVLHSVPPGAVAVGVPARITRRNVEIDSFLYHKQARP